MLCFRCYYRLLGVRFLPQTDECTRFDFGRNHCLQLPTTLRQEWAGANGSEKDQRRPFTILKWAVLKGYTNANTLLEAVALYLSVEKRLYMHYERIFSFIDYLFIALSVDVSQCHEEINRISNALLALLDLSRRKSFDMRADNETLSFVTRWLEFVSHVGVDVQQLRCNTS